MCRATPFVLLLLLSMNATAEPKALRVPADYPTLAAAIEAAAPGDTVALAAGQYPLTAQLLITKPVQIKGEAAESTVIQTTLAKDELIKVDKVDGFRIENVTLEYAGPPQPQDRTDFPSLLSVFGGRAEVEHCNFRNSSGFGLIIKQGAGAAIRHCRAENNLTVGIYVKEPGTSASVTNNEAIKNGSDGIMTYDGATASVEENRCAENGGNGIIIDGPTAGDRRQGQHLRPEPEERHSRRHRREGSHRGQRLPRQRRKWHRGRHRKHRDRVRQHLPRLPAGHCHPLDGNPCDR